MMRARKHAKHVSTEKRQAREHTRARKQAKRANKQARQARDLADSKLRNIEYHWYGGHLIYLMRNNISFNLYVYL